MIKVNDFIETGFSANDAEKLLAVIQPMVDKSEKVSLDFSGIKIFTTLFFNNALSKFLVEFGPEKYADIFEIANLSEVGQSTYQHSIDNAKDYYGLPDEGRKEQTEILENLDD